MSAPRSPKWREKVWLASDEREAWWARLNGWTLTVSCALSSPHPWRAGLHRFTPRGMADMPMSPRCYDTREEAQRAAEHFARHGEWPQELLP